MILNNSCYLIWPRLLTFKLKIKGAIFILNEVRFIYESYIICYLLLVQIVNGWGHYFTITIVNFFVYSEQILTNKNTLTTHQHTHKLNNKPTQSITNNQHNKPYNITQSHRPNLITQPTNKYNLINTQCKLIPLTNKLNSLPHHTINHSLTNKPNSTHYLLTPYTITRLTTLTTIHTINNAKH